MRGRRVELIRVVEVPKLIDGPCGTRSLTHLRNRHSTKRSLSLVVSQRQAVAHSPVGKPLKPDQLTVLVAIDPNLEDARIRFGAAVRWVPITFRKATCRTMQRALTRLIQIQLGQLSQ